MKPAKWVVGPNSNHTNITIWQMPYRPVKNIELVERSAYDKAIAALKEYFHLYGDTTAARVLVELGEIDPASESKKETK